MQSTQSLRRSDKPPRTPRTTKVTKRQNARPMCARILRVLCGELPFATACSALSLTCQRDGGFDFDLCRVFDEAFHLDHAHCRKMPSDDLAIGGAHFGKARFVHLPVGHIPGKPNDLLASRAGGLDHGTYVKKRLTHLRHEIGREFAGFVPADLTGEK